MFLVYIPLYFPCKKYQVDIDQQSTYALPQSCFHPEEWYYWSNAVPKGTYFLLPCEETLIQIFLWENVGYNCCVEYGLKSSNGNSLEKIRRFRTTYRIHLPGLSVSHARNHKKHAVGWGSFPNYKVLQPRRPHRHCPRCEKLTYDEEALSVIILWEPDLFILATNAPV